ncbi:MAG: GTP 3',8-cyclase MoaA [Synergistes sp.]|nr:GTP 3',8-cyclase MoaA [Synergistes sp.]
MGIGAELKDSFGRKLTYLRVSVTDRCNYRCLYCMPPEGVKCIPHADILRYEEIKFLCGIFCEMGIEKFRFTGGEPLVRRGLVPFLKELHNELPQAKIALTTNASLLSDNAEALASSGISALNISLDTLNPERFKEITRIGTIDKVIEGIDAAVDAGIENIKINTVLIRGFNDKEIPAILKFAEERKIVLRLIEFMPLQDGIWHKNSFISGSEILSNMPCADGWREVKCSDKNRGPAQYYENDETGERIGIITAVSNHFCSRCNRLRLSALGNLRTCLFNPEETPLKDLVRNGDAEKLRAAIYDAVARKPRCWNDIRDGHIKMSGIGG